MAFSPGMKVRCKQTLVFLETKRLFDDSNDYSVWLRLRRDRMHGSIAVVECLLGILQGWKCYKNMTVPLPGVFHHINDLFSHAVDRFLLGQHGGVPHFRDHVPTGGDPITDHAPGNRFRAS